MTKDQVEYAKTYLATENSKFSRKLAAVPKPWPDTPISRERIAVWRSNQFMVQVFKEDNGIVRLTVNRVAIDNLGNWKQDVSWDDLQNIKRECGFSDCFAVEIYPEDEHIVNVSNMRHLWVLPEPLPFGWRKGD